MAQAQQNGICGAIYDALTLTLASDAGNGNVCMAAWNEMDGSYGKMDDAYNLRPAAHVYQMFNSYVYGNRVATTSSAATTIVPYASKASDGRYSILLTNRTKAAQTVKLALTGWTPTASLSAYQLTPSGYGGIGSVTVTQLSSGVSLPAQSVTVLTSTPLVKISRNVNRTSLVNSAGRRADPTGQAFTLVGSCIPSTAGDLHGPLVQSSEIVSGITIARTVDGAYRRIVEWR